MTDILDVISAAIKSLLSAAAELEALKTRLIEDPTIDTSATASTMAELDKTLAKLPGPADVPPADIER